MEHIIIHQVALLPVNKSMVALVEPAMVLHITNTSLAQAHVIRFILDGLQVLLNHLLHIMMGGTKQR